MAIGFQKPRFDYDYSLSTAKADIDRFFSDPDRAIPTKRARDLDLATWNIANLGIQKRRDKELRLIAHIISKFDIVAVQEVNAKLERFLKLLSILKPMGYEAVFTDPGGNSERLAVIYKTARLRPRQLAAELDYNPNGKIVKGQYTLPGKKFKLTAGGKKYNLTFYNFNRNPHITSWEVVGTSLTFMLASTHIYWGEEETSTPEFRQRVAEVYFLADWVRECTKPSNSDEVYDQNIIILGDMNIPTVQGDDPVFKALKRRGLRPTRYATQSGTTLQEFTKYDQMVLTNDDMEIVKIKNQTSVVLDFDNFVFGDLYRDRSLSDFKRWTKWAVSDHRPLFIRIKT